MLAQMTPNPAPEQSPLLVAVREQALTDVRDAMNGVRNLLVRVEQLEPTSEEWEDSFTDLHDRFWLRDNEASIEPATPCGLAVVYRCDDVNDFASLDRVEPDFAQAIYDNGKVVVVTEELTVDLHRLFLDVERLLHELENG
jgi:allophanate hydrolase subunit 1